MLVKLTPGLVIRSLGICRLENGDNPWISSESEFLSYVTSLHYSCFIVLIVMIHKICFESHVVPILRVRRFKIPYRTASSSQKGKTLANILLHMSIIKQQGKCFIHSKNALF